MSPIMGLLPGRPTESLRSRLRRDRPDPVGRTSQIHRNPRTTRWPSELRRRVLLAGIGVGRSVVDRCPPLRLCRSSASVKFEWGGRIDELLRAVENRVGLVRLALETDGDLGWRLGLFARWVDVHRGNLAGLEINLDADECD